MKVNYVGNLTKYMDGQTILIVLTLAFYWPQIFAVLAKSCTLYDSCMNSHFQQIIFSHLFSFRNHFIRKKLTLIVQLQPRMGLIQLREVLVRDFLILFVLERRQMQTDAHEGNDDDGHPRSGTNTEPRCHAYHGIFTKGFPISSMPI